MKNPFVTIFKKPTRVIIVTAVVLAVALAVGLAANQTTGYAPGKVTITTGGTVQPIVTDDPANAFDPAPLDTYVARKWLDYYLDDQLPWNGSMELELPEYPGTTFRWTPNAVTAREPNMEKPLFSGMPVWNVYLDDLTGDGLPELCATVSFGSGIVDTRVVVHDYARSKHYELSDRMSYDYVLSLKDGHLLVTQSKYNGEQLATGDLLIINDELTAAGIDRTRPTVEPSKTTAAAQ